MPSQLDLDQGGTNRQLQKVYLGPSIGWIVTSYQTVLNVNAAGTTTLLRSTTLVLVSANVNGVVIQLPSARSSPAGDNVIPGIAVATPVTIVDAGGFANAHNISILPFGSETIDGLASLTINSNFAAYVLRPNLSSGGWTLIQ
jgi:hypothetical protein